MSMKQIPIGTLTPAAASSDETLSKLIPLGFESFAFTYWMELDAIDPAALAAQVMPRLRRHGIPVSAVSLFANPLLEDADGARMRKSWLRVIETAAEFDCRLVTGFTGRLPEKSVPENIERFREVWTPLAEAAQARGVRIAWENCPMGGTWESGGCNLAINPDAWELLFDAVPCDNVGLEWEPCHQMAQLIEPLPQIREWGKRFFHIHGKDATVRRDLLARHGAYGKETFAWHRTPGFGDSNWTDIISELRMAGYAGTIDIEGWHDPVYRDELEMTGQVHGLNYLKRCRGGDFVEF